MSDTIAIPGAPDREPAAPRRMRRPWLAATLSLLLPGLGQWYAGAIRRSVSWLLGECGVSLVWLLSAAYLPVERVSVILPFVLWAAYRLSAAGDAWRITRHRQTVPITRFQRWWACLLAAGVMYLFIMGFAILVRAVWFEAFVLPTEGMTDTLLPGDRLVVDKLWYRHQPIRHGEIVVFFSDGLDSPIFVQRVIGLPGDVIELRDEVVFRNGEPLDEPYVKLDEDDPTAYAIWPRMLNMPTTTVPAGEVFLMGDNRQRSEDSRTRGAVPIADVLGPVMTIYWSKPPPPSPHATLPQGRLTDRHQGDIRWERIGRRVR